MVRIRKPRPKLKRLFVWIDICPYCRKKFISPSAECVVWNYLQHATSCKRKRQQRKKRKG